MPNGLKSMDSFAGFEYAKAYIEQSVKSGAISREKASQMLKDARKNYSNQSYNKMIDKQNYLNS